METKSAMMRIPNQTTVRTFKNTDARREMICCLDSQDLFDKLGI
jgi:hypothetical protein